MDVRWDCTDWEWGIGNGESEGGIDVVEPCIGGSCGGCSNGFASNSYLVFKLRYTS